MITGRKNETDLFNRIMNDENSRFVAVYGRRRVGKTFLIREAFGYRFTFQHSGMSDGGLKEQLSAFSSSLREAGFDAAKAPANWQEAFEGLKELIRQSTEKRKVIFIDELSWMDTPRCDLLSALENFWNGFVSARKDVVFIICASATSWMLSKVIHNKGGLYNRLTDSISLQPFSLRECEEYVRANGMALNRIQILQYYMIFGGVPYYWGFLQKGFSLSQNIDRILFAKNAPLRDEFKYLYASVFKNPTAYLAIIEALSRKKGGMTREEILNETGLNNSGDFSEKLTELESCGFIRKYNSFGAKKKNAVYQLADFFTLFYYAFLADEPTDEHFWSNQINTPAINTWMGFSFERVCMEHISQIKNKLGISGVLTEECSWFCKRDPDKGIFGSQIDLLIKRKDQVINLCEMKYSGSEYTVTEVTDQAIRRKINDFVSVTGTKYAIYPTIITVYGLVENSYSGNIQSVITADDLFA